ncbi:hypothetical protein HK099_002230 [Clydaea vesicula]|uniref:Uncharacterized protein n=1 Tax=Clydaea vesicula TaxID=447962 RepID=A0AAD5XWW5_9FUNG|nr:hypothetical protein HK099_002230 [Clydaea vesicula]
MRDPIINAEQLALTPEKSSSVPITKFNSLLNHLTDLSIAIDTNKPPVTENAELGSLYSSFTDGVSFLEDSLNKAQEENSMLQLKVQLLEKELMEKNISEKLDLQPSSTSNSNLTSQDSAVDLVSQLESKEREILKLENKYNSVVNNVQNLVYAVETGNSVKELNFGDDKLSTLFQSFVGNLNKMEDEFLTESESQLTENIMTLTELLKSGNFNMMNDIIAVGPEKELISILKLLVDKLPLISETIDKSVEKIEKFDKDIDNENNLLKLSKLAETIENVNFKIENKQDWITRQMDQKVTALEKSISVLESGNVSRNWELTIPAVDISVSELQQSTVDAHLAQSYVNDVTFLRSQNFENNKPVLQLQQSTVDAHLAQSYVNDVTFLRSQNFETNKPVLQLQQSTVDAHLAQSYMNDVTFLRSQNFETNKPVLQFQQSTVDNHLTQSYLNEVTYLREQLRNAYENNTDAIKNYSSENDNDVAYHQQILDDHLTQSYVITIESLSQSIKELDAQKLSIRRMSADQHVLDSHLSQSYLSDISSLRQTVQDLDWECFNLKNRRRPSVEKAYVHGTADHVSSLKQIKEEGSGEGSVGSSSGSGTPIDDRQTYITPPRSPPSVHRQKSPGKVYSQFTDSGIDIASLDHRLSVSYREGLDSPEEELDNLRQQLLNREAEMDAAINRYESYIDDLGRKLTKTTEVTNAMALALSASKKDNQELQRVAKLAAIDYDQAVLENHLLFSYLEAPVSDTETPNTNLDELMVKYDQLVLDNHLLLSYMDEKLHISSEFSSLMDIPRKFSLDLPESLGDFVIIESDDESHFEILNNHYELKDTENSAEDLLLHRELEVEISTASYESKIDELTRQNRFISLYYQNTINAWKSSMEEIVRLKNECNKLESLSTQHSAGGEKISNLLEEALARNEYLETKLNQAVVDQHLMLSFQNDSILLVENKNAENNLIGQIPTKKKVKQFFAENSSQELAVSKQGISEEEFNSAGSVEGSLVEETEFEHKYHQLVVDQHLLISYLLENQENYPTENEISINQLVLDNHLLQSYYIQISEEIELLKESNLVSETDLNCTKTQLATVSSDYISVSKITNWVNNERFDLIDELNHTKLKIATVSSDYISVSKITNWVNNERFDLIDELNHTKLKNEQFKLLLSNSDQLVLENHLLQSYHNQSTEELSFLKEELKNTYTNLQPSKQVELKGADSDQLILDNHLLQSYHIQYTEELLQLKQESAKNLTELKSTTEKLLKLTDDYQVITKINSWVNNERFSLIKELDISNTKNEQIPLLHSQMSELNQKMEQIILNEQLLLSYQLDVHSLREQLNEFKNKELASEFEVLSASVSPALKSVDSPESFKIVEVERTLEIKKLELAASEKKIQELNDELSKFKNYSFTQSSAIDYNSDVDSVTSTSLEEEEHGKKKVIIRFRKADAEDTKLKEIDLLLQEKKKELNDSQKVIAELNQRLAEFHEKELQLKSQSIAEVPKISGNSRSTRRPSQMDVERSKIKEMERLLEGRETELGQMVLDHHLLLSYQYGAETDHSIAAATTVKGLVSPNSIETVTISLAELEALKADADKCESLTQKLKDTEARLRARDLYLQNTIMDTAKRVAELENRLIEQQGVNEDLERELKLAARDKEEMENELQDLDHDNMILQNQLNHSGTSQVDTFDLEAYEESELGDDYVVLRDMEVQTDLTVEQATSEMPSSSEQQIMSVVSRLTYSNMIVDTQKETIQELESKLKKVDIEKERIIQQSFEKNMELERIQAVNSQRAKLIDELWKRVEKLETDRTSIHLKRTVTLLSNAPEYRSERRGSTKSTRSTISQRSQSARDEPDYKSYHQDRRSTAGSSYLNDELVNSVRETRHRLPTNSMYSSAPTEVSVDTVLDSEYIKNIPDVKYKQQDSKVTHPKSLSRSSTINEENYSNFAGNNFSLKNGRRKSISISTFPNSPTNIVSDIPQVPSHGSSRISMLAAREATPWEL